MPGSDVRPKGAMIAPAAFKDSIVFTASASRSGQTVGRNDDWPVTLTADEQLQAIDHFAVEGICDHRHENADVPCPLAVEVTGIEVRAVI